MPYNMSDPKYWFDRADEVRTSANSMTSPANKARMLRVAEDFEILGRRADQLPKKIVRQPPRKKRLRRLAG
jgi:hypothetical protein